MASVINKLSALGVSKLDRPGYFSDGGGLWLQVSKTLSKSWIFRYRYEGKRREMGLGSFREVDLATARARARACRALLAERRDPLAERAGERAAHAVEKARIMTFDQCAAAYIDAHRKSWKSPKHARQWENTLSTYARPVIGAMPVGQVDTDVIVKVLNPIWQSKTETATRLRGRIESILGWATVRCLRTGDNPARWHGHLENLLASPGKIAPVKNHPALPWSEMPVFMVDLRQMEGVAARALEFTILTACRSGEVRGASWSEINLDEQIWTIPAERMKAGKEHRVPLSTGSMSLLRLVENKMGLLFPGRKSGTQLSDMSLTAVLRRMSRGDITVHGFRSTFRDWCAEDAANSFSREVCEHALAHSLPDKVEAAYRRGDLLEKRIRLMQAWSDYCKA